MRATLAIDDDVLLAAKEPARREGTTASEVLSDLARKALQAASVVQRLARATASPEHEFRTDDLSLLDAQRFDHTRVVGHRQLSDPYLLGLAVARRGCMATLGGAVPLSAARGARADQLVVV